MVGQDTAAAEASPAKSSDMGTPKKARAGCSYSICIYTAYTFLIDEQTCMLGPTEDQDWFLSEWEIDDQWCLGCHASPRLSEEGEWAPGCPRGRACEMEAGRRGSPLFAQSAHLLQGQDGPRHDHDMTCMHGIHNNP